MGRRLNKARLMLILTRSCRIAAIGKRSDEVLR